MKFPSSVVRYHPLANMAGRTESKWMVALNVCVFEFMLLDAYTKTSFNFPKKGEKHFEKSLSLCDVEEIDDKNTHTHRETFMLVQRFLFIPFMMQKIDIQKYV